MSTFKKTTKSKFMAEDLNDLLNHSQYINGSPKTKKVKRQVKEKGFNSVSDIKATPAKKQKMFVGFDACGESRQKTLNVMNRQLQVRKQIDDSLLKDLTEVVTNLDADNDVLKENVQKLEQLTGCLMKCMQQTTAAHKDKLKAFKGVFATFKKECEETEAEHRAETEKLGSVLEEDINKLKQKLISETKRSEWENLQKSFFRAMQNNF
ncbi:uncharacterized protein LOC120629615 [Pararge aegeria]|uniref:uncharacterized protein LOC120629615 n=1 Tax=Pararge aegeria TaxID=116150 RepID=UPI0019D29797|nr:uncharacterized protein LOC120629615 [Pararge aegeria]